MKKTFGTRFEYSLYKEEHVFKGGTSLMKAYDVIKRFSEDLDLFFNWNLIGRNDEQMLNADFPSRNKAEKFVKETNKLSYAFIEKLEKQFNEDFKLFKEKFGVEFKVDTQSPETILMTYDSLLGGKGSTRLEIGCFCVPFPTEQKEIKSLVAEEFPALFKETAKVEVLGIERTALEKLMILHKVAKNPKEVIPNRYSRHYYDVFKIFKSEYKNSILEKINELLPSVIKSNVNFYSASFADYDKIPETEFSLMPSNEKIKLLKEDYEKTKLVYFEQEIDFEAFLKEIKPLEEIINNIILKK